MNDSDMHKVSRAVTTPALVTQDGGLARPRVNPFAGRVGGAQLQTLSADGHVDEARLRQLPDASPFFSIKDGLSLRGLLDRDLWRFAFIECVGSALLTFCTGWASIHPASGSNPSNAGASGVYGSAAFLGPLVGGMTNWIFLALFIYALSGVSGAHLNPTISLATFFTRLITLPRLILYVLGQTAGAAVAGRILTAAYGSREFLVGGCAVDTSLVPASDAFLLEFMFTFTLIFLAFGVGLDPRQSNIIGPTLGPIYVGLVLGVLSFGSSFSRPGYDGASMNPARCFGAYVGSQFPGYHWIHWVGPFVASIGHGILYFIVPPWKVTA